jgi:hypothetical protein
MNFKKIIYHILKTFLRLYREIKAEDNAPLRLEEIDINKKQVIIRSHGAHTFIKLSLAEALGDPSLIANLHPKQACMLGYYFGISYAKRKASAKESILKQNTQGFLLQFKKGRYKIISLDRKGDVTYINTKNNDIYNENPMLLVAKDEIIKHFDPSQACYLGILAGINQQKQQQNINTAKKPKPFLRVIK